MPMGNSAGLLCVLEQRTHARECVNIRRRSYIEMLPGTIIERLGAQEKEQGGQLGPQGRSSELVRLEPALSVGAASRQGHGC